MPRKISIFGILMPSLLLVFAQCTHPYRHRLPVRLFRRVSLRVAQILIPPLFAGLRFRRAGAGTLLKEGAHSCVCLFVCVTSSPQFCC